MLFIKLTPTLLAILVSFCSCARAAQHEAQTSNAAQNDEAQASATQKSDAQKKSQPRAPVDPNKFAVVIAGVGGEPSYTKKFTAQAVQLYDALTKRLGFDEKNVYMLTEVVGGVLGGPENGSRETESLHSRRATADEVRRAFDSIKSAAKPDSTVLVVLIGHGSFDTQQAKFNLVGPDLTAKDYSQLISALPARRVVFVNCSSASGEFVKPLSGENRIVITATRSGNEQNATVFAEHFIAGLSSTEADGDKNGRVSVLEAFDYATKVIADWYKQQNRLATEHALLDDNGDGTGHESATAGDGALAKTTYLDSKPVEQARGDAELARLINERQRLEEAVEKLKARKSEMKQEDYDRELENLLIELAKVNQAIKARQK